MKLPSTWRARGRGGHRALAGGLPVKHGPVASVIIFPLYKLSHVNPFFFGAGTYPRELIKKHFEDTVKHDYVTIEIQTN